MSYKLRKGTDELETQSDDTRDFMLGRGWELVGDVPRGFAPGPDGPVDARTIKETAEDAPVPDRMKLIDEDDQPVEKKGRQR